MNNNKGLGAVEILMIIGIVLIFIILLTATSTAGVEADGKQYESIVEKIDEYAASTTETTTEIHEEPDKVYISANYGPEAGVVKEISLDRTEEKTEEETTEVSPEFEQLVIESFEKEPEVELPANIYNLTMDEQYLLASLAMCEAGNQDTEGKALVILTVLNRVADPRFPNTIHDVVFQPGQFTPAENGALSCTVADDDCWGALDLVNVEGWDESQGCTYFCATYIDFWWADYLFTHGGHNFYR